MGQGYTAEIYAWGEYEIVKLFYKTIPQFIIDHELNVSQAVDKLGLPVPKVFGMVDVEGKKGIVYERIVGITMTSYISRNLWNVDKEAKRLAELHYELHKTESSGLPSQKNIVRARIEQVDCLTDSDKQLIREHLDRLPDGNQICHGDFHPDNIMLTRQGPVIIDWTTGTSGNPLADVARTILILKYGALPSGLPAIVKLLIPSLRKRICNKYVNRYLEISGSAIDQINEWMLPITAARLSETIPEEEKGKLRSLLDALLEAARTSA
ncbi:aminoglycoside phosphotransferase family protein [Collibacillus ludicampi]